MVMTQVFEYVPVCCLLLVVCLSLCLKYISSALQQHVVVAMCIRDCFANVSIHGSNGHEFHAYAPMNTINGMFLAEVTKRDVEAAHDCKRNKTQRPVRTRR